MKPFRSDGLRSLGSSFSVDLHPDEAGYVGRECPVETCEGYFKITLGTGIKGLAPCHCPYCGHTGEPPTFATEQQIEYAKSIAFGQIMDAVRHDLKALECNYKPTGPFRI